MGALRHRRPRCSLVVHSYLPTSVSVKISVFVRSVRAVHYRRPRYSWHFMVVLAPRDGCVCCRRCWCITSYFCLTVVKAVRRGFVHGQNISTGKAHTRQSERRYLDLWWGVVPHSYFVGYLPQRRSNMLEFEACFIRLLLFCLPSDNSR